MNYGPAGDAAPFSWLTNDLPVAVVQFSADGLIKGYNDRATLLLQEAHLDSAPSHFADWLSQVSAETLWQGFEQIKKCAGQFQFEARFLTSHKARRCLLTALEDNESFALIVFDSGLSEFNSESNLEAQVYSMVKESTGERAWVSQKSGKPRFLGEPPGKAESPDWNKLSQEGFLALSNENAHYEAQLAEWTLRVQTGRPFQMDAKIQCQDGVFRWHRIFAQPNKEIDAKSDYLWCGVIRSIETEKQLIDLVANVSHEIRTPLNGILGMAQMLSRCQLSKDARDYAQTIQSAGTSLLTLVNEVLDYSRLEAGKHQLKPAELDVISIMEDVAQLFSPAAAAKNLLLISTIGKLPDRMQSDPQTLRQVLLNLLSNAVKFTEQGFVQLSVQRLDKNDQYNWLKFSIRDSGQGIDNAERQRLFLPYSQGAATKSSEKTGTGLGLSISQKLAELMGGHLYCETSGSQGSIFTLEIPVGLQLENAQNNIADIWAARSVEQIQRRVIVLEESENSAAVISQTSETFDLLPSTVSTCKEAIKLIEAARLSKSPYHAIFLDNIRKEKESREFLDSVTVSAGVSNYGDLKIIRIVSLASDEDDPYIDGDDFLSNVLMPLKRRHVMAALRSPGGNSQDNNESSESARTKQYDTNQLKKIKGQSITQTNSRIKRALVADDHEINQKVAAIFLRELGLEVDLVADGVEAVQAFKDSGNNYDLIFLDCQMPRLGGLEAAPIIKEMQKRRGISIPLIAVTSGINSGDREKCLMSGMDDFLGKPLIAENVEKMVTKWLGQVPNNFTPGKLDTPAAAAAHPASNKAKSKLVDMQKLRSNYDKEELDQLKEMFDFNFISLLNESKINLTSGDDRQFRQKIGSALEAYKLVEADSLIQLCDEVSDAARQGNIGKAAGDLELVIQKTVRLYNELQSELADRTTIPHLDSAR